MRLLVSIILSMTAVLQLSAQSLTGKLIDETQQPMPYANVILLSLPDSAFVAGTISDESGTFLFPESSKAQLVCISSIGYKTLYKPCVGTDLGIITLSLDTQELGEVIVKGNLPRTRLKNGVLTTNIQHSVLSDIGSANDVLVKVPGIQGKDGDFTVFGKGEPVFYINGRMVRDNAELERLHSKDIKSVDVITNPGAQYDATVKAVVLIKTLRPVGEGLGFNVRTSHMYGKHYFMLNQVDLNYRHEGLDIIGSLFYSGGKDGTNIRLDEQAFLDTPWTLHSEASTVARRKNYKARLGANYLFNERHSIGVLYDYVCYTTKEPYYLMNSQIRQEGTAFDEWTGHNRLSNRYPYHLVNAYYAGNIGKLSVNFNTDVRRGKTENQQTTLEDSENQGDRTVSTRSDCDNGLFAGKLVLEHPLWKGNLSLGSEYTNTYQKNHFKNEQGILDDTDNEVKENTASAFLQYNATLGKFTVGVGIRYEHNAFDYYENGEKKIGQSKTYDNLFPSASVAFASGKYNMDLSYTRKTQRPSYSQLDGNMSYVNRYTYLSGNPLLKPVTTSDVTMVASFHFFQFIASYQHMGDDIVYIIRPLEESPYITHTTYENFKKMDKITLMLSASPTIGCWNLNYSAGIIKQIFELAHRGEMKKMNRPMFYASLFNTFSLPKDIKLTLDAVYMGKGNIQNMMLGENKYIDVNISKKILKSKALQVKLECLDVFDWKRNDMTLFGMQHVLHETDSWTDMRRAVLTVRYNFNSSKGKYRGTGAGEAEKARL